MTKVKTTDLDPTGGSAGQAPVIDAVTGLPKWANVASSGGGSNPFRGALVGTAGSTGVNYSAGAAIPWDVESYDTDSIHDNVTNNSRLTVPAGVTKVRLSYDVQLLNVTANTAIFAHCPKNGSGAYRGNPLRDEYVNFTVPRFGAVSAVIDVVAGDYFELFFSCSPDTSIDITGDSWFCMEIVESSLVNQTARGCLVTRSADWLAQNLTGSGLPIPFDVEQYDTDGIHSTVTNTTRLTVPTGVTKVRLKGGIRGNAGTAGQQFQATVLKNGISGWQGQPVNRDVFNSVNNAFCDVASPVLSVVAGDYFELNATCLDTDTSIDIQCTQGQTWFCMEIVEAVATTTGVVAARAWRTSNYVYVANANVVPMQAVGVDTGGLWDAATGRFKIKTSGYYTFSMRARTTAATNLITCGIAVNGSYTVEMGGNLNTGRQAIDGSGTVYLNAGDTVTLAVWGTAGGTLESSSSLTWCSIVGPF